MASRLRLLFNVNDENLRKDFLRTQVAAAVGELSQSSRAQWGNMTPQQMVEHLVWALEISNGLLEVKCDLHPKLVARMKGFLFDNTPTSHEFMNPELKKGLPPNRFYHFGSLSRITQADRAFYWGIGKRMGKTHNSSGIWTTQSRRMGTGSLQAFLSSSFAV